MLKATSRLQIFFNKSIKKKRKKKEKENRLRTVGPFLS
jgi:hypothetical protein